MQSALVLAFGGALMYLLFAFLAPWNFYLGSHFHFLPGWAGRGWMRSAAGGDYYLSVSFSPTTPGYRKSPLKGAAYLCAPKAKNSVFTSAVTCRGTDVPVSICTGPSGTRSWLWKIGAVWPPPSVQTELYGPRDNRPWKQESARVTLEEDSSWELMSVLPGKATISISSSEML